MDTARQRFTDKDAEKLVSLLNFVALNAVFSNLKVKQIIEFQQLLNWAQTQLLPKIEANVFEITEVRQLDSEKPARGAKK